MGFKYSNKLIEVKNLINVSWDHIWLYVCVIYARWFIKFHNVHFIGDLLRRMTMLSGASDTNANACLFMRLLYTYCPPSMAFDEREQIFAPIFLERQYVIATWIIRAFGLRILPPPLRLIYLSYYGRATKASEFVHRCLDNGTEQLIILGAGFDSTAYRLRAERIVRRPRGTSRYMEVFEVDRPSVQERKLKLMKASLSEAELLYYTEGVHYVGCEFGVDSIGARLVAAGFDPNSSTAILWEGVTYYLNSKALSQTLSELQQLFSEKTAPSVGKFSTPDKATDLVLLDTDVESPDCGMQGSDLDRIGVRSCPRPLLFMDYMSTAYTRSKQGGAEFWLWDLAKAHAAALGTPYLSGFSDVEAELSGYGFKVVDHLDSDLIEKIFDRDTTDYHQVFKERNSTFGQKVPKLALVECEFVAN